jgi:hypothetical protein
LQPNPQAQQGIISWNDFCRAVLKLIAELSPCPEPTLFVVAGLRGLQRFGDGTLEDLKKLLGRCVRELRARGLVKIDGEQLVITSAGTTEAKDIVDPMTEDDDILELTTVAEGAAEEDILLLTAEPEHQPSLRTSKLDEPTTNQEQQQTQAEISGGTASREWHEELQKKWATAEGKIQK